MAVDPGHEFTDVLCQLAGANAVYAPGAGYPAIDNSGFMASYAKTCAKAGLERDSAEVLKASPWRSFRSSMCWPAHSLFATTGTPPSRPTFPNRMFVHGASSAGLDHSPTLAEIAVWEHPTGTFSIASQPTRSHECERCTQECPRHRMLKY